MAPKLSNCPRCRKIFIRVKEICEECYQKQEDDYQKVAEYLRMHNKSTLHELSKETNVTINQIRQFIVSHRLILSYFPNLSYPCEQCENMIREGKHCSDCLKTINQLAIQIEKSNEALKLESKRTTSVYRSYK
jgi:uncharacterized protein